MQTIDAVLKQVEALPSSPQILPKLLTALNDPDTDIGRITDLIAFDPGLTARVLQLCNSAAFAGGTPTTDISEAVGRVGLRPIYKLVAAASGRLALHPTRPVAGLEPEVIWKHSVTAALAAQLMAEDHGDDASSAFTAALLHEAGKLVLAQAFGDAYGRMLSKCVEQPDTLAAEEQAEFQIDHAEAGGRLLTRWKFPPTLAASVTFQHRPAQAGDGQRLAAYVHLGNALAQLIEGRGEKAEESADLAPLTSPILLPATVDALGILNLPTDAITRYRDRTMENFEFVNALCRL
jgi:HD-like signal output (HDOD) protein